MIWGGPSSMMIGSSRHSGGHSGGRVDELELEELELELDELLEELDELDEELELLEELEELDDELELDELDDVLDGAAVAAVVLVHSTVVASQKAPTIPSHSS
jgi:hypothetical protein